MKINFIYAPDISLEEMIGYEIASIMWGKLFTDDIEVNILAQNTDTLDTNVIGGAMPTFHEQHYALFLQYYEADITSEEDQIAFDALQQGNTVDFLLDGDLVGGNTKLKLTTALAKALGMTEAISIERYLLDESEYFVDGTIMMNQGFTWDFNYLRNSEAAENTLDFMSVALHETGHILGFTSSLDFSLQEETLFSGRTELSNFSPLDLFRFSAESLSQENPDGTVGDLSIGGVAWFSPDGGETLTAKMSTGKEGDGYQASHWERRYDPLGIMDPTLWYQERASITDLDVLAFDLMGYDLSSEAANVEQLFESQNLEAILAQAKIQLANKLGYSVQYIEDNANVPVSSLDLIAEIEAAMLEAAQGNTTDTSTSDSSSDTSDSSTDTTTDTSTNDSSNSGDTTEPQHEFTEDVSNMAENAYEWWGQGNGNGNSWWQNLYEWWGQGGGSGNGSWAELFEWWSQGGGSGNGSWAELFEWWSQGYGGGNGSWAELYEWWGQGDGSGNSWWQEAFFASQDGGNLEDLLLPGKKDNTTGPAYEQKIKGGNDDDIIGGDISDDLIKGKKGDDLIDGAEGDDTIFGGSDFDTIFGFDGHDSVMGGGGDDFISGESDNDVLFGEGGSDVLMGGDHDDYLDGGKGRDFLSGDIGDDVLIGAGGDDALEGEAGKDLLVGGAGEDIGNGGSGDDYIFGDEYSASLQEAFGNNLSILTNYYTPAVDTDTDATETPVEDNTNSNNNDNVVLAQDPLRVEAEDMSWTGQHYKTNKSYASGGKLIRPKYTNQEISGTTNFTGATGTYDIIIGYHDLEEANGQITVEVNGTSIGSWNLTKDLGDEELEAENFTTHTISNVPLTVNDVLNLQSIMNYSDEGGEGALDYIEFVPVVDNTPTDNNSDVVLGQDPIVIEAENMNLSGGYYPDDYYYNGTVIRTGSNPSGVASSTFTGETGYYQVKVHYIDESDGNASLSVKIANTEIDNWVLNQNTSGSNQDLSRIISQGMHIDANAAIEIQGQRESGEYARVDYIEFILLEPPATNDSSDSSDSSSTDVDTPRETTSITPELELGSNSDILRGGAANDGIDGGAGNDIIFGENEFNDSSDISPVLVDDGVFQNGHSTYILSQAGTWQEAQAEAQMYGGNLVTINDAAEEAWLKQTFGISEELWIGFTDQDTEGTFQWASGEIVTYTNWVPGEPNNSGTSADYARMNYNNSDSGWGDLPEDSQLRGIIEIDWSIVGGNDTIVGGAGDDQVYGNSGNDVIYGDNYPGSEDVNPVSNLPAGETYNGSQAYAESQAYAYNGSQAYAENQAYAYNGSQYVVTDSTMTWEAAQAYAQTIGGNLVTVNDASEEQWLQQTFGTSEVLWIGLSDAGNEGTFEWASGEVSNYTNWSPGQPDDYNGSQDYIAMNYTMSGTTDNLWDDRNYSESFRGIIEIKLPSAASGNDNLFGNGGHDIIRGGAGNDVINGTDEIVAGYLERDTLEGGAGADKFILGDETQAFYSTGGAQDYAVIEDFNAKLDTLEVHGSLATDYQVASQGSDVHLSYNGDLVAILKNTNFVVAPTVNTNNFTISNLTLERISVI